MYQAQPDHMSKAQSGNISQVQQERRTQAKAEYINISHETRPNFMQESCQKLIQET